MGRAARAVAVGSPGEYSKFYARCGESSVLRVAAGGREEGGGPGRPARERARCATMVDVGRTRCRPLARSIKSQSISQTESLFSLSVHLGRPGFSLFQDATMEAPPPSPTPHVPRSPRHPTGPSYGICTTMAVHERPSQPGFWKIAILKIRSSWFHAMIAGGGANLCRQRGGRPAPLQCAHPPALPLERIRRQVRAEEGALGCRAVYGPALVPIRLEVAPQVAGGDGVDDELLVLAFGNGFAFHTGSSYAGAARW